ncbi:shikimate kinase [Candidatus Parcubacteria bacterium]|nr:MAG: shikimate kinase [Candidatus Parcubacteria bacterium]
MNITLIGMPGSGKSFIGKQLADRLGFSFIEIDKIIEKEFDRPLQQIVEKLGNEVFLGKEAQTTIESTTGRNRLVVSPGGSVIYRGNSMDHLKKISLVFYLKVPLEILKRRIGNVPRGVVIAENKTFADLYVERVPLYEKYADYVIEGNEDPQCIIKAILTICDQSSPDEVQERDKIPDLYPFS